MLTFDFFVLNPAVRVKHLAETSAQHQPPPTDTSSFLERLNAVEEELDCSTTYHYEQVYLSVCSFFCSVSFSDSLSVCHASVWTGSQTTRTVPVAWRPAPAPNSLWWMSRWSSWRRSFYPQTPLPICMSRGPLWRTATGPLGCRGWWHSTTRVRLALSQRPHSAGGSQRSHALCVVLAEEAEDEDDPEYNFLDDLDEPDLEDYRTDRAVQITSRSKDTVLVRLAGGRVSALNSLSLFLFSLFVFQRRR